MIKQTNINKLIILKVVRLTISFLKSEGALKTYIKNINQANSVSIASEKELKDYIMGNYLSKTYYYADGINPISHFFIWSKTSEGQDFWASKNKYFLCLRNRIFREKYSVFTMSNK